MAVIGFLCVSLGISTVQLHNSLGSRHIYAFQRLVSVVKMATVLEECFYRRATFYCAFLWAEGLDVKDIHK
jgi:hypothetical protein